MSTGPNMSEATWEKGFSQGVDSIPTSRFRSNEEDITMRSTPRLHKRPPQTMVSMPPELFEKLYATTHVEQKEDVRKTFANPTPLALLGFVMACSPLACDLMGWRGAGNHGLASIGAYYYMGGLLMFFGGILEYFIGETFAFVVFCSFGAFWFSYGLTLQPVLETVGFGAPPAQGPDGGINDPTFQSSFAFYMLFMSLMCFVYLICALRTNVCFVLIFLGLGMEFVLLAAEYWQLAQGNVEQGNSIQKVAGAFSFLACISGWYIFIAQMLDALDYIITLPVGDLSNIFRGASQQRDSAV